MRIESCWRGRAIDLDQVLGIERCVDAGYREAWQARKACKPKKRNGEQGSPFRTHTL